MARVKPKRHGVSMDMTAMCDVAFLLLTFFILTTQFKSQDTVEIKTPSSVATEKLEEKDMMIIAIGNDGKYFFSIKNTEDRIPVLQEVAKNNGLTFNKQELATFRNTEQFGLPLGSLKQYLNMPSEKRKLVVQTGMPNDSIKSELVQWTKAAATVNANNKLGIKGDVKTQFVAFKSVLKRMQEADINKFKLITNSESKDK